MQNILLEKGQIAALFRVREGKTRKNKKKYVIFLFEKLIILINVDEFCFLFYLP